MKLTRCRARSGENDITAMAVTPDFLIYGTARGGLHYFYIKQWADVNEFRHDTGIRKVFPPPRDSDPPQTVLGAKKYILP